MSMKYLYYSKLMLTSNPKSENTASDSTPKSPALLKDQACKRIKSCIFNWEFDAENYFLENRIAKWLGMSKTPVNAALARLEHEGFVSVSPRQGVVVHQLSIQEVHEHFDLRIALETFVVRKFSQISGENSFGPLEENLMRQQACMGAVDIEQSVRLDGEFHVLLAQLLDNREISKILSQIRDKIYRISQRVHRKNSERLQTNYPEHRAILDAILARDAALAEKLMAEHLESGRKLLLGS